MSEDGEIDEHTAPAMLPEPFDLDPHDVVRVVCFSPWELGIQSESEILTEFVAKHLPAAIQTPPTVTLRPACRAKMGTKPVPSPQQQPNTAALVESMDFTALENEDTDAIFNNMHHWTPEQHMVVNELARQGGYIVRQYRLKEKRLTVFTMNAHVQVLNKILQPGIKKLH